MARGAGVTLTGDWRKLNAVMRRVNTSKELINSFVRIEADSIRHAVITEITGYNSVPNTDSTVHRKGKNEPLTETGTFGSTLGVIIEERRESDKKIYFTIKGNPNVRSRRTGLSYEAIAEIMETGSSLSGKYGGVIPPRPVFSITFDRMKDKVSQTLITKLRSSFRGL